MPRSLDPGSTTWDNPLTKQFDNNLRIITILHLFNRSLATYEK